jgi:hypothetical protein
MREVPTITGDTFWVNAPAIGDHILIRPGEHPQHGQQLIAYDVSDESSEDIGWLRYIMDFPEPGFITVHDLWVSPEYLDRGVALELCFHLHADNPDHKIDPGAMSETGMDFVRHILAAEPIVRETVVLLHPSVQHLAP